MLRSRPLLLCALAILASPTSAHVRLFYSPAKLSIRNARGATSDGSMSTSGACGGANTWGANGVSSLKNGASVSLRINYNGGHKSAQNAFSMAFACGKPGDQKLISAKKLAASACTATAPSYPNPSPRGNEVREGYTVTCKLPEMDLAATDGDKCSISVLDQRNWGGCVDVTLEPSTPPVPPVPAKVDHTGVYVFQKSDNIVNDPTGACCMLSQGDFKLTQGDPSALSIGATFTAQGACASGGNIDLQNQAITLTRDTAGGPQFRGSIVVKGQSIMISAVDKYVEWTNVAEGVPVVCDGFARLSASGTGTGTGTTTGGAPTTTASGHRLAPPSSAVGLAAVVAAVVALAAAERRA